MEKIKRQITKIVILILLIAQLMVIESCHAQKHHKSVPCPCEKKKK